MPRLIHCVESLRPGGGPPGYLYNLKQGLSALKLSDDSIKIVSLVETQARMPSSQKKSRLRIAIDLFLEVIQKAKDQKFFPSFLLWLSFLLFEKLSWRLPLPRTLLRSFDPNDRVIFHSIRLAARARTHRAKDFAKMWIMPHGPTNYAEEISDYLVARFGNSFSEPFVRRSLTRMESRVYSSADGLVLAQKNAAESYFQNFPNLKAAFQKLPTYYILSGARRLTSEKSSEVAKSSLGLSSETFLVSFFGRFHSHKGFDFFLKLADQHSENNGMHFLCAGAGDLERLIDPLKVQNLGWRTDIEDLIQATDVVLVPNRHTYFDLIVLEALSMGKVVLTTNVGGNVYFQNNPSGVVLYEAGDINDCVAKLSLIRSNLSQLSKVAHLSYEAHFSLEAFADRHVSLSKVLLT